MTLSQLQWRRKIVPFGIAIACILLWFLARPDTVSDTKALTTLFLTAIGTAFLYVIAKIRDPLWDRERDRYVGAQIRRELIELIPEDLNITSTEKDQLARSAILKQLTGVFWEAIDRNEVLRAHKVHFYSNGLEYTTAIDAFLLCSLFALLYAVAFFFVGTSSVFFIAILCSLVAAVCKVVAIPRARRDHLALSAEQLDLVKRESGDFVADQFRNIVLAWRSKGRPQRAAPTKPPRNLILWRTLLPLTVCLIVVGALTSRGYLGPGPNVKATTQVSSSYVTPGLHQKPIAVVFVHGVFGTKDETWLGSGGRDIFPKLLAGDPDLHDTIDVFTFEYFTPKFGSAVKPKFFCKLRSPVITF